MQSARPLEVQGASAVSDVCCDTGATLIQMLRASLSPALTSRVQRWRLRLHRAASNPQPLLGLRVDSRGRERVRRLCGCQRLGRSCRRW
eukprot:2905069-Rhodomonas_salina.1